MEKSETGLQFPCNSDKKRKIIAKETIIRRVSDSRVEESLARIYLVPLVPLTSAKWADVSFTINGGLPWVGKSEKTWPLSPSLYVLEI